MIFLMTMTEPTPQTSNKYSGVVMRKAGPSKKCSSTNWWEGYSQTQAWWRWSVGRTKGARRWDPILRFFWEGGGRSVRAEACSDYNLNGPRPNRDIKMDCIVFKLYFIKNRAQTYKEWLTQNLAACTRQQRPFSASNPVSRRKSSSRSITSASTKTTNSPASSQTAAIVSRPSSRTKRSLSLVILTLSRKTLKRYFGYQRTRSCQQLQKHRNCSIWYFVRVSLSHWSPWATHWSVYLKSLRAKDLWNRSQTHQAEVSKHPETIKACEWG